MKTLALLTRCSFLLLILAAISPFFAGGTDQSGNREIRAVFEEVQLGITQGNAAVFSPHLHTQVRVTLRGGESGLYSANQATCLLQQFISDRSPVTFAFTTYGESDNTPFATGSAGFTYRGVRQHAQIYVALAPNGSRWVITHINIY